jgi:concanavalin A-like lectin/glucanase superfamily protein/carbohydrate binding protein with CBM4/9 domain/F5/8 type C domain-containing protein
MKNRGVWLLAALFIGLAVFSSSQAQDVENLLANGGFEDGVAAPWSAYSATIEAVEGLVGVNVLEPPVEGNYCLHVEVPTPGTDNWSNGLQHAGHVFEQDKKYTWSAWLKCSEGTLDIRFKPELGADPWTGYGDQVFTMTEEWQEFSITTPVFTEDVSPGTLTFHIGFAVGEFWVDGSRFYEGDYVPPVFQKQTMAADPSPESGAVDVPQDVVLSWGAGELAVKHDVYFGSTYDDVNDATIANPLGTQVSSGQSGTTFDPEGLLEFGQTYYWRADEVNAAPDNTVFKGNVWSFTAEPFVYPIENIIATASSAEAGAGPENTIDGSGLNASDQHSIEATDMWLSDVAGEQPAWIQYQFDGIYMLHEMSVWNYNVQFEPVLGFGIKDVAVEYSTNGAEWTALGDFELGRATAKSDYAANTTIDLTGVVAKYVRLTVNSNWGGMLPQFGLSEVRFLYKPVSASEPMPMDGQADVELDLMLDWRGGREATVHEVYLSGDRAAVESGAAFVDTLSESRYAVDALDLGSTYYWKVDEVNEAASPSTWAGTIWSFSTKEFFPVEDFESYDDEDNRIYDSWLDGWVNDTGSTVGYLDTPFAERSIVSSGRQSMPLEYNNTAAPFYSEAEHDLGGANWMLSGSDTLVIHFRGRAVTTADAPGNDPAPLYVAVEDGGGQVQVVIHPDPEATVLTDWQAWEIPFSDLSGVSLTNVRTIYIGVGDRDNPAAGGAGLIFIDDIQVGHPGLSDPGTSGLAALYALEENTDDSSGNENHGTVVGDPIYVPGKVGSGLEFNGTSGQYVNVGTFNPSAATGQLSVSLWANWNGLNGQYQGLIGKRDSWAADDMMWQIEANIDTGIIRFQRAGLADVTATVLPTGEWASVAVTFDGTTSKIYMGGELAVEAAFSFGSDAGAVMQVGASEANGGNPFNGALDEIRLYDRVLSPFEIRYLANQ